ncbi:MAG: NAD(P)-binding domain-containing protein [Propionicimonas sp.]
MDVVSAARSADVVVIGAGQAGLGDDQVPGLSSSGDKPKGYLAKDDIVALLERYATANQAPVFEGVAVEWLDAGPRSGFVLRTSAGELTARAVVVCSGAFQKPHRPAISAGPPARVPVLDASDYRNPSDIGPGRVVIVGSGQTGCQLAEELTWQAGTSSSREDGRRGCHVGSRAGTPSPGSARPPSSTSPLARCPARRPGWCPTPRRPAGTAGTTSTTARCKLEAGVESWLLVGVDSSGWDDFGDAVGAVSDVPAVGRRVGSGFDDAVVVWADEYQAGQ